VQCLSNRKPKNPLRVNVLLISITFLLFAICGIWYAYLLCNLWNSEHPIAIISHISHHCSCVCIYFWWIKLNILLGLNVVSTIIAPQTSPSLIDIIMIVCTDVSLMTTVTTAATIKSADDTSPTPPGKADNKLYTVLYSNWNTSNWNT